MYRVNLRHGVAASGRDISYVGHHFQRCAVNLKPMDRQQLLKTTRQEVDSIKILRRFVRLRSDPTPRHGQLSVERLIGT